MRTAESSKIREKHPDRVPVSLNNSSLDNGCVLHWEDCAGVVILICLVCLGDPTGEWTADDEFKDLSET